MPPALSTPLESLFRDGSQGDQYRPGGVFRLPVITRKVTNTSRELPAPTGDEAAPDERPSTEFICVCGRSFQTVRGRNIHRTRMKCSLEVDNSAGSESVNGNNTLPIEGSQEMLLNNSPRS